MNKKLPLLLGTKIAAGQTLDDDDDDDDDGQEQAAGVLKIENN